MPELPEVETVKRGLDLLLAGQTVKSVEFDNPKSFPNSRPDVDKFLINSKITKVRRRAKVLIIDLSSQYSLIIHLKMTGQLVYRSEDKSRDFGAGHPNDSLIGRLPDKSTRVIFGLTDGKLFFNDQRKFGWARLVPTIEIEAIDFFRKLGPEPLSSDFTAEEFSNRIQRRANSNIKAVLLDQTVLAGIGNIYADESLFASRIHPTTLVKNITTKQRKELFKQVQSVLQKSIDLGGSSDKNYVDAEGKKGSYLKFAKVFRRDGQPCLVCGTIIDKSRVAGRGTHTCPVCQPKPSQVKK